MRSLDILEEYKLNILDIYSQVDILGRIQSEKIAETDSV